MLSIISVPAADASDHALAAVPERLCTRRMGHFGVADELDVSSVLANKIASSTPGGLQRTARPVGRAGAMR